MSSRIRILPENLTNKIAAGEVVERPASVVKELVENALDAGATDIVIEIEAGGKRLIGVSDNGSGMSREDALLALERHATSKISTDDDLLAISTLGFRGEALPSIASVSRFILSTREKGSVEGTEIYAEGGRIREVKACGKAEGTVIQVRNLFFNTPARMKFLKSTDTEAGHVTDHFTRLALSRPDVRFSLISEGKALFRVLNGTLLDRVTSLLSRVSPADLIRIDHSGQEMGIEGLAAKPDCNRSSAAHLYTFVNGRFVRDRVFQHAILQAYRNVLERGRYPVAALFLSVPPGEVDVNVHPTKFEVRFREQSRVHDFIAAALDGALMDSPWLRKARVEIPAAASVKQAPPHQTAFQVREVSREYGPENEVRKTSGLTPIENAGEGHAVPPSPAPVPAREPGVYSSLSVIGQYLGEYLLCQDGEDLLLIDQHAAHERVAYERLRKELEAGSLESQGLLFPEVLELSHSEAVVARENLADIEKFGFYLEEFGGNALVVKAVPKALDGKDFMAALRDTIEDLRQIGRSHALQDVLEKILIRIACHGVIRGCRPLSPMEIASLLDALDSVGFAGNCPHGRPIVRRITRTEVEKMFKRV